MIPLYGFLEGDTIGMLMLARPDELVAELADRLQVSASVRVARVRHVRVEADGRTLEPTATVAQAGLRPLQRFDVRRAPEVP